MYLRLHQYLDDFLWLVKIFNLFEFLVFMVFWKFEKLMNVDKILARFFSLLLYYGIYNDGVFLSPYNKDVDHVIDDIKLAGLDLEDRGDMANYFGINFSHEKDNTIIIRYPYLIQ